MRFLIGFGVLAILLSPAVATAKDYDVLGVSATQCTLATGKIHQGFIPSHGTIAINLAGRNRCQGKFSMDMKTGNMQSGQGIQGKANLTCNNGANLQAFPVTENEDQGHGHGAIVQTRTQELFYFVFSHPANNLRQLLKNFLIQEKNACAKSI